jgi:hypothetical protein
VAAAVLATTAVLLLLLDVLIDEPVRRWLERGANARVEGYSIRIPSADFRPWILAGTLYDVEIRQEAHPDVPVARVARMAIDVDWGALLSGRFVGDLEVEEPVIHIDTVRLREEWSDSVDVADRGWQRLWELYPLKINRLSVVRGRVDYLDTTTGRELELSGLQLEASNIRHVTAREAAYPSPVAARATLFGSGSFELDGHANFLLQPHAGFNVVAAIDELPLAALGPIATDYRLRLRHGLLSARGQFEVAPDRYIANLATLDVDGLSVDYLAGSETEELARAKRGVAQAARYADRAPEVRLRAREASVTGTFGYVSATEPAYRVYLDRARLRILNFSNRAAQGESRIALDGLFMGSGRTRVRGVLRPDRGPNTFAFGAQVVGTDLPALNDLLRAHGRLDASAGQMSVYAEVAVDEGRIRGYVKPLFRDVEIYEAKDDEGDNFFRRTYERIAEAIAKILENQPREEVVTIVDVSGPVGDPDVSTLQVIGNLLRNAFIRAILPGFDAERERIGSEPAARKPRPGAAPPLKQRRGKGTMRYAAEVTLAPPAA